MDLEKFLFLLTLVTVIVPYMVNVFKLLLDELKVKYSSNLLAVICSCFVSALVWLPNCDISFNSIINYIYLCVCSSMSSMLGYDKVKQMILQLKDIRKGV